LTSGAAPSIIIYFKVDTFVIDMYIWEADFVLDDTVFKVILMKNLRNKILIFLFFVVVASILLLTGTADKINKILYIWFFF